MNHIYSPKALKNQYRPVTTVTEHSFCCYPDPWLSLYISSYSGVNLIEYLGDIAADIVTDINLSCPTVDSRTLFFNPGYTSSYGLVPCAFRPLPKCRLSALCITARLKRLKGLQWL